MTNPVPPAAWNWQFFGDLWKFVTPFLLAINKVDLAKHWEVTTEDTNALSEKGWQIIRTSAKDGVAVEEAFSNLASRMLAR